MDYEKLLVFCGGNKDATDLIRDLWKLCCVWDNCVDRDKINDETATNSAFLWALFGLHDNVFYKNFEHQIRPAIYSCVASWIVANKFEKSGDVQLLERSYVMRCSPYELFGVIALLSGGFQSQINAIEHFQSIKNNDTLEAYLHEHRS